MKKTSKIRFNLTIAILLIMHHQIASGAVTITSDNLVGAVQTLTFSSDVQVNGGNTCADLLTEITHLGTDYTCSLDDPTTLVIKYGYSPDADPQTITLTGLNETISNGAFTRPTLPTFTITETGITTGYQDNTVTLTASPSWSGATTTRSYAWSYGGGSAGSTPDISGAGNSFTFNYWLMTPGTYNIEIRMSDTDTSFYYDQTKTLIVQDSCVDLTSCNVVGWKLTNNPGSCTGTYITGINVGNGDDITLAQSGSGPYILTATYNPGSVGGNALSIDDSQCDNSFTTVSCGSTIQFPTITETTVGAIQKFTFSQLVAASGGSNCADFLDSTTHLGTGYSCSIINTPNPATLEIKYGYSPAATPPTLTLKPAAFSPCVVGNFTRTTLPTFTITETGITTGYQDNTVTLTASPSWSGATTTRSYAWSYGGGSAGSTPDISGAGNSFTFNYWLMTPGTYNIEIRMSDTDTSFYYDQTKTLIVQDSCVDLTSCNVVGWKLTNNPGSCTGTYITGINVGNGDDITLAQSGSGPYILTATYNPGSVGGNALSIDDSQCDNSFTTVSCGSTIQFPTITETTVGAIQKFTFSQLVAASGGSNCADFLDSTTHLGTGYSCSIINTPNPATLEIKYGYSPAATPPTLTLKPAAFSPCVVGNFTRTTLPTFTITETGITTGYQDNTVTLTVSPSWSGATTTRSYAWSYGGGSAGSTPDISGAGNSFTFNYWLMTPGTYNIEIRMSDTDTSFYYDQTKTLIVQDSCVDLTSCNVVGWKLTNNPGSCTGTYITGINVGNGDDITLTESGSGPYILTATYNPGSVGGNALSIDDSQCDNSFTTVSCGSTIQFPTITETTVGAIQKFTFSQLVAASGGSNCADFLDSTTHLGTGYSCSIINTPNPATLEIKYGYSPAATPPTLTLKPAAFSPCVVGNFTRTTLPTFTITETGITTGYQDNTVTLTVSPSWSGATTTRSYAWSYGGGSAGSTPDISGAGNSFTFNYWLMTPGTYNIEIRMSDTDTSFYYDQTKTLIVQDSCVDLTSCNVVGWKLTNNPGSCTGTYITGINVGNGDDITLTESGSGPYILTATYNPGSVGGNALSIDDSQCDNSFTTVSCGSTIQFPTITETTVGAIQKFTFSQLVAASGGSNCADFLDSTTHLGTGYSCSIINTPNPATLEIKYGYSPAATPPTLTLKPAAFSPCVVGNFTRTTLPTFTITETGITTGYQDNTVTLTVSPSWSGATTTRSYAWSYGGGSAGSTPDISGAGNSFTFNYWLMTPGTYNIEIRMRDTDTSFYYDQTKTLIVQDSCVDLTSCNVVGWKLTNNPGSCTGTYITGINAGNGDDITLAQSGSGPYILTATYNPGSVGGNALSIDDSQCDNSFTTVSCGNNIKFPTLILNQDSPAILSSSAALAISGTLNPNSLPVADYSLTWVQTGLFCSGGGDTCNIAAGALICTPTPYEYKLQLKMTCKPSPWWIEIAYTPFTYGITITESTEGSIQKLTFSEVISAAGGSTCGDFLDSTAYLGTGYSCTLSTVSTTILTIKYGHSPTSNPPTHNLITTAFTPCATGSFTRGSPEFSITESGAMAGYQDHTATLTPTSTWQGDTTNRSYTWGYVSSAGPSPVISGVTAGTYNFNYWIMTPGAYQVNITIFDSANPAFYIIRTSSVFTVLDSCLDLTLCDVVAWKLTHNPGACYDDYVTGITPANGDTIVLSKYGINPYIIKATYQPGSKGGNALSIDSSKCYNSFTTVSCGSNIKFPTLLMNQNSPSAQPSSTTLTISGTFDPNGLVVTTDYTLEWSQSGNSCVNGNPSCSIPPGILSCTTTPYEYILQLKISCKTTAWGELIFTPFTYGATFTKVIVGSVQTITFSENMVASGGTACADLLTSTAYLGVGYSCSFLTPTAFIIKYGHSTVEFPPKTISLNAAGFTSCINTALSFKRPILPKFELTGTNITDPSYQDNIAAFRLGSFRWFGSSATRVINWSYLVSAGATPDLSGITDVNFDFNYWIMTPGDYKIHVALTDSDNPPFIYEEDSGTFTVLESCASSCDVVTWTLTHNPGSCNSDCLSGRGSDSVLCTQTTNPSSYTLTGTYQPGSVGSRTLTINSGKCTNSFTTVSCGIALKFSKIVRSQNAPAAQSSGSDLTISGSITTNGLILDTDYSVTWVQPTDFTTCVSGSSTCTVLAGSLTCGGPYAFATQLKMLCQGSPVVWSAVTYTEFTYGDLLTVSNDTTTGSVQEITFGSIVAASSGTACSDLLSSTTHLGSGYSCEFISTPQSILTVKYGVDTVDGDQLISLRPEGVVPCSVSTFDRPILPSFKLTEEGIEEPGYQDNVANFKVTSIVWKGSPSTQFFSWSFATGNGSPPRTSNGESYQLIYWLLTPGEYQIKVSMRDSDNSKFSYEVLGNKFVVLESCNTSAGLAEVKEGACTLCDASGGFKAIGKECISK